MSAKEARRPWFQKQVGKLLLDKASRENQRAAALRILEKPDEAAVWNQRAAISFAKCAAYWQETPVYNDLKIGEARAILQSGDSSRALTMFKAIKLEKSSVIYPSYSYYLGQTYEKLDDDIQAQKCFQQAMSAAEIIEKQQLDHYIDLMSKDRRRAKVICSVRLICGVSLNVSDLTEKLEQYGIKPKPEPEFPGLMGLFPQGRRPRKSSKPKKDRSLEPEKESPPVEIEIEFNKPSGGAKKSSKDDFSVEFLN